MNASDTCLIYAHRMYASRNVNNAHEHVVDAVVVVVVATTVIVIAVVVAVALLATGNASAKDANRTTHCCKLWDYGRRIASHNESLWFVNVNDFSEKINTIAIYFIVVRWVRWKKKQQQQQRQIYMHAPSK